MLAIGEVTLSSWDVAVFHCLHITTLRERRFQRLLWVYPLGNGTQETLDKAQLNYKPCARGFDEAQKFIFI